MADDVKQQTVDALLSSKKDFTMKKNDGVPQKKIKLLDPVFAPRQETGYRVTIPGCIRRCEETGRLKAFKLQWKKGEPEQPHVFWDSDVAKVLEGMAEMLMVHPDPAMEKELDELVDLIVGAQQEDGYLNVHFTVVEPEKRWSNLGNQHELYCAGHLIEAAVAHFEATGSRKFLDAMCRYADYIASVFGPAPGQKRGYPGHEEIELALVRLYRAVGEKRYLELAKFFIDERGAEPSYFVDMEKSLNRAQLPNRQAHKPVRLQEKAVGHAVRAVYLYCGMVDVAVETQDSGLLNAAVRLFDYALDYHDQFAPFYSTADGILLQTGGHAEGSGFKTLAVQHKTARLPVKKLYPVPRLVHEDIDITVARVTTQFIRHYSAQRVVALPHVGRPVVQPVPHAVIQAKHGSTTPGLLPVSS